MAVTQVPHELFVSFFEPSIRVLLNWDRLKNEQWPIRMKVITQADELSQWYAPWYIGKDKREVDYSETGAKPLRLVEISQSLAFLNQARRDSILSLSKIYVETKQPVQLVVPAYALNNEECLVLDGNHRLAGTVHSGVRFTIMMFTVHGPLDRRALPDLKHWVFSNQR